MNLPPVPVVGGRTLAVAGLLSFGVALLGRPRGLIAQPGKSFWSVLQRRKVYNTGVLYALGAWRAGWWRVH